MIGHLGTRVSALLDGQLAPEEAERAWEHVHQCHACRDLVEREGWVKTRLAGLCFGDDRAPADLKGSLLHAPDGLPGCLPPGEAYLAAAGTARRGRARAGIAALGGGAAGAAVVGVLVLGTGPADAPDLDRPVPVAPASVSRSTPTPSTPPSPARTAPSRRSAPTAEQAPRQSPAGQLLPSPATGREAR